MMLSSYFKDKMDKTEFIEACKCGNLEVVKDLVEQGVDFRDDNGEAVGWASIYGHLEVIKYLVEKGANVQASNNLAVRWASR